MAVRSSKKPLESCWCSCATLCRTSLALRELRSSPPTSARRTTSPSKCASLSSTFTMTLPSSRSSRCLMATTASPVSSCATALESTPGTRPSATSTATLTSPRLSTSSNNPSSPPLRWMPSASHSLNAPLAPLLPSLTKALLPTRSTTSFNSLSFFFSLFFLPSSFLSFPCLLV